MCSWMKIHVSTCKQGSRSSLLLLPIYTCAAWSSSIELSDVDLIYLIVYLYTTAEHCLYNNWTSCEMPVSGLLQTLIIGWQCLFGGSMTTGPKSHWTMLLFYYTQLIWPLPFGLSISIQCCGCSNQSVLLWSCRLERNKTSFASSNVLLVYSSKDATPPSHRERERMSYSLCRGSWHCASTIALRIMPKALPKSAARGKGCAPADR
jgi:hypothetical protein